MQRTVIINGRQITIEQLGQPMDSAFDQLHVAYYGNTPPSWNTFAAAALQYFSQNATVPAAHDAYFNCFTVIWQDLLAGGRHLQGEQLWERALQPALQWEQANPGQLLHKGTPYYFWAMTALLHGDTDRGYLLIHQSVDEDIRTSRQQRPNTPGYALVTLNYGQVAQLFRQWVLDQATFLDELIFNYNVVHGGGLTLTDVTNRFLNAPPDPDTLFLLTYTLARLMGLNKLPTYTTNNPFAGQLQLNLLFDVTLVIDAAIKAKNNPKWKFIDHAERLLAAAGVPLTIQQLGDINVQFNSSFDTTVQAALDGNLTIAHNLALNRLQCDVALAYGLRNYGAHNSGTATIIWNRFPDVQKTLFRVLFKTIDDLY